MAGGKIQEKMFNGGLCQALKETTPRWKEKEDIVMAERSGVVKENNSLTPDILVLDPLSPPVVVETSYSKSDADGDAKNKYLGKHVKQGGLRIVTAFSVFIDEKNYPRSLRNETEVRNTLLRDGSYLDYALYQWIEGGHTRRFPAKGFIRGSVYDLAQLLSMMALTKENMESAASEVAEKVNFAADILEGELPQDAQEKIMGLMKQRTMLKGLRTTMVLWLNALHIQQRLSQQGVKEIKNLGIGSSDMVPSEQLAIWKKIIKMNWRSIFEPAVDALGLSLAAHPNGTGRALRMLRDAVEVIENFRIGIRINVGAELFPKLSEDRKQAAAFYTSPATAELLAALTISDLGDIKKSKLDRLFKEYTLIDLACGTGTLLRAGYHRIMSLYMKAGGKGKKKNLSGLHRDAMEGGLRGTDISPIASHLTSASLAALGNGEPYGDTQIGWVGVGYDDTGTVRTGALEYLQTDDVRNLFGVGGGRSVGTGDGDQSVTIRDNSAEWVLMNPPYSRTRGGQSAFDVAGLDKAEREACQKRWGRQIGGVAEKTAGMAASFLALARNKVRPGGRIGFVLPLTAASANSWKKTRQMIEREFIDITVVAVSAGKARKKARCPRILIWRRCCLWQQDV